MNKVIQFDMFSQQPAVFQITVQPGEERHTQVKASGRNGMFVVEYQYRHYDGRLFNTLSGTVEGARKERDKWIENNFNTF